MKKNMLKKILGATALVGTGAVAYCCHQGYQTRKRQAMSVEDFVKEAERLSVGRAERRVAADVLAEKVVNTLASTAFNLLVRMEPDEEEFDDAYFMLGKHRGLLKIHDELCLLSEAISDKEVNDACELETIKGMFDADIGGYSRITGEYRRRAASSDYPCYGWDQYEDDMTELKTKFAKAEPVKEEAEPPWEEDEPTEEEAEPPWEEDEPDEEEAEPKETDESTEDKPAKAEEVCTDGGEHKCHCGGAGCSCGGHTGECKKNKKEKGKTIKILGKTGKKKE